MGSISWLQILSYLSFLVLIVGVGSRVMKYLRMPMHLRWELYPIPHEKKDGSYFEEIDWWKKPRKKHHMHQAIFMAQEILFVRALFHHNRKMWYWSFPFHFGLYLIIAWLVLLSVNALLSVFVAGSGLIGAIQQGAVVLGATGFAMGTLGCVGLLFMRMTSEDLQDFTAPVDYFNLLFLLAVVGTGLVSWLTVDSGFVAVREFLKGLLTFSPAQAPGGILTAHIVLFALFLIYVPFTHMTHFVMKYFMWDKVRFEDEPNLKGSAIGSKVAEALNYRQSWSAPHMHKGTKWSETATKGIE